MKTKKLVDEKTAFEVLSRGPQSTLTIEEILEMVGYNDKVSIYRIADLIKSNHIDTGNIEGARLGLTRLLQMETTQGSLILRAKIEGMLKMIEA